MLLKRLFRLLKSNLVSSGERPIRPEPADFSGTTQQADYQRTTAPPPPIINSREAAYYAALEVSPNASFEEIKRAYKMLIKKYHPDRFGQDPQKRPHAETVTRELNEAYAYFEEKYKT